MTAQLLNEWAGFAAWAVLAWLILTTVGALPLAALGLSKRWWPFLGAPVGVSVVALATFLTVVVPVHWVWWWPVLVALVVSGSIWAIRAGLRTTSDRASLNAARGTRPELPGKAADKTGIDAQKKPGGVSASAFGWTALGSVGFIILQFTLVAYLMRTPDATPIFGDAQFHLAGAKLIVESGDVSPLTAVSDLYEPGRVGAVHYYPTLWHGLVALLVPAMGLTTAHNLVLTVAGFLIWPIGLGFLASVLAPNIRWVGAVVTMLASLISAFPGDALVFVQLGPYGLGLALLPSVIAVTLLGMRHPRTWWFPLTLLVIGSFGAHPSAGLLALIPVLVAVVVSVVKTLLSRPNRLGTWILFAVMLLVAVGGAFGVTRIPYYQRLAAYGREVPGWGAGMRALFLGAGFEVIFSVGWVLVVGLAVYAAWALRREASVQALLSMGAAFLVIFLSAAGPEGPFRGLSGPWWKDYTRLVVPCLLIVVVLGAVGLARGSRVLAGRFFPRLQARQGGLWLAAPVTLALVAVGYALAKPPLWSALAANARAAYSLDPSVPTPLNTDTAQVLAQINDNFEDGTVVLGAHYSGVGFVPAYSESESFIPMPKPYTADQIYVSQHIDDILVDPRVCQILESHGVEAFLESPPPDERTSAAEPGFLNLNTAEGFELVASSGPVSLYRITACD